MKKILLIPILLFCLAGVSQTKYTLPYDTVKLLKPNLSGYTVSGKGIFYDTIFLSKFKFTDGNQQSGYVITSDANGNASWQAASGGGGTNENIGTGNRLAVFGTNDVKTVFSDITGHWDSASNADALTYKVDSVVMSTRLMTKKQIDSIAALITNGTVTNIATGFGILGGPITTTGTLKSDTSFNGIITWALNKKKIDSLAAIIATKGVGTVISVGSGYGLYGGAITSSGALVVDSNLITTRLWHQKSIDSLGVLTGSSATQKLFLDSILNQSSYSSLTGYTAVGGTWGTSGGNITVTGGTSDYTKYLQFDYYSQLENVKYTVRTIASSAGTGVAIGTIDNNARVMAYFNYSTGVLQLDIGGGTTIARAVPVLATSASDTIDVTWYRQVNMIYATARNVTTNSATISCSYRFDLINNATILPQSTGKYAVYAMQAGQINIVSQNIVSTEVKNADLLILGDSKTMGCYAGAYQNTFVSQLQKYMDVVRRGGSGDMSSDWVNALLELLALNPKVAILTNPSNDLRNGVAASVTHANYEAIYNALIAQGVTVYNCESFYESSQNNDAWNTYLAATFPSWTIIPMYTVLKATGALTSDGIHLTSYGDSLVYNQIIKSLKITKMRSKELLPQPNIVSPLDYTLILKGSAIDSLSMLVFGAQTNTKPMFLANATGLHVMRASGGLDWDLSARDFSASGGVAAFGTIASYSGAGLYMEQSSGTTYLSSYSGSSWLPSIYRFGSTLTLNSNGTQPTITATSNQKVGIATVTSPTAYLHLQPSLTAGASLRIPTGTAPDSPNEGDIWHAANRLRMYTNSIRYTVPFLESANTYTATNIFNGVVGIGASASADASAQLDVNSTTKGFLPPRMTATQASAISSPAEGLLVYVTNTNGTFTAKGWWGYDGANWVQL